MNLYANAVAAERAAKIARDMADHEAGIDALREENKRLRIIEEAARNLCAQKGRHNTEIAYRRLEDALTPNAEFTGGEAVRVK